MIHILTAQKVGRELFAACLHFGKLRGEDSPGNLTSLRSVALKAAAVQECTLAILTAELIPTASRYALVKLLTTGQSVGVFRGKCSHQPSRED
jgi:hypothetical protein